MEKSDFKDYQISTRSNFSNIIRKLTNAKEGGELITDIEKTKIFLTTLEECLQPLIENKDDGIWWWRENLGNNHIHTFKNEDTKLKMNYFDLEIEEIYINNSPINIFDFIIIRSKGNQQQEIEEEDLKNINFNIREFSDDGDSIFNKPINFIITAKFGLPNLDVYTDDELAKRLNELLIGAIDYSTFKKCYEEILRTTDLEIQSLHEHLTNFPMLALENPVAQKVHKIIPEFPTFTLLEDTVLFRARVLENINPYKDIEMWNPPVEKVHVYEGRYNHYGQSYLYLASNVKTAMKETTPIWHRACSIAEFQVAKKLELLDLRLEQMDESKYEQDAIMVHYMLIYRGALARKTKNIFYKPEYAVPRFVADVAKMYGFEGIIFNSTKDNGENIVLFHPNALKENKQISIIKDPYVYWELNL